MVPDHPQAHFPAQNHSYHGLNLDQLHLIGLINLIMPSIFRKQNHIFPLLTLQSNLNAPKS